MSPDQRELDEVEIRLHAKTVCFVTYKVNKQNIKIGLNQTKQCNKVNVCHRDMKTAVSRLKSRLLDVDWDAIYYP